MAVIAAVMLVGTGIAGADVLHVNDLVTSGDTELAPGGTGSATVWLENNNSDPTGDATGCNAGGSGANPTVTLSSSNPLVVTIDTPASKEITGCGTGAAISFGYTVSSTATHNQTATISGSVSGGKAGSLYNTADNFTVTVKVAAPLDTAPPTWSCSPTAADGIWHATDQSFTCSAQDASGLKTGSPASFTLSTSVTNGTENSNASTGSQSLCDIHDNCTTAGPITGNKIDKKKPYDITFSGSISDGDSYYFGFVPADDMACDATDDGSGLKGCVVTGYGTGLGNHTLTATATDNVDNSDSDSISYSVLPWTATGFYRPVDMGGILNTVKGGSTVPLKFEVFAATELTDIAYIDTFKVGTLPCGSLSDSPTDEIEVTSTGGTSLRYDTEGGQFIQNWKTPATKGICYKVTLTLDDGSEIKALFKTK